MYFWRRKVIFLPLVYFCLLLTGCADKNQAAIQFEKVADFTDRRGQANVRLYTYSGEVDLDDIKTYSEKMGCNMLYAYFYPATVPLNEIPMYEINAAGSYNEVQEILYEREGYARWHYAVQCFAVIPFITDCIDSPVSQNCR